MNYKPLSLYYLNQMDIIPWIHKKSIATPPCSEYSEKDGHRCIIILCTSDLSKKAAILLRQIEAFINHLEFQVVLIKFSSNGEHSELTKLAKPLAILNLGINQFNALGILNVTCPLFTNPDLESLLANPVSKRKIFEDLLSIQLLDVKI